MLLQSGLDKRMVGGFYGVLLLSAKHFKISCLMTPYERRFGLPFNGPEIPFGAMVEYHPISAKDLSRLHQFGPKVVPCFFFGYALNAERIWKGDILPVDIEDLEQMDASEIHARRLNAKEVLTPMKNENFVFPVAGRTFKTPGEDRSLGPPTLIGIVQNEDRNKKFFEYNQADSLLHPHIKMTQHEMMRKLTNGERERTARPIPTGFK